MQEVQNKKIEVQELGLKDYKETLSDTQGLEYTEGGNVWEGEYDIAIPSATQNEVDEAEAEAIVNAGATIMCQAANMPCTHAAVEVFRGFQVFRRGPGGRDNDVGSRYLPGLRDGLQAAFRPGIGELGIPAAPQGLLAEVILGGSGFFPDPGAAGQARRHPA